MIDYTIGFLSGALAGLIFSGLAILMYDIRLRNKD